MRTSHSEQLFVRSANITTRPQTNQDGSLLRIRNCHRWNLARSVCETNVGCLFDLRARLPEQSTCSRQCGCRTWTFDQSRRLARTTSNKSLHASRDCVFLKMLY